jgi:transposase
MIDPYAHLVDAWLAKQPRLKASVIHERLVAEHGSQGHYQRVKVYVRENRARLTDADPEPVGFHRRFEVLPGAQAQVDWGDEGELLTAAGPLHTYSFHMTLSYSRDPFCCYVAAQDLGSFWDCHRRAFAHFGGVPATIVYDRTKTVIRRHVGRGQATPLHPEAVAFAAHYGFVIWLAAANRPQTKGRVERQVELVRSHVLCGRAFASLQELDAAFAAWLPTRRAQVHRTHGEVIAVRAQRDRAALSPLPDLPYVVCDRHIRRVGKDALISFAASHYSVPWRKVRPGSRVELRVTPAEVAIFSLGGQQRLLATHPRAASRGSWVVDPTHWDGLPDRADTQPLPPCVGDCELAPLPDPEPGQLQLPGIGGWASSPAARVLVAQRRLGVYDLLVGVAS